MTSTADKILIAKALLGTHVRFHHDPTPRLVTRVTRDGMLEVEGYGGQFAAHLFETVDPPFAKSQLDLVEWLTERLKNCERLAASAAISDREAWIEDGRYFGMAIAAIRSSSFGECAAHCTVCEGQDHHWMTDSCEEWSNAMVQQCKHCPARRLIGDDEETH